MPAGVVFTPVDWITGERAIPRCDTDFGGPRGVPGRHRTGGRRAPSGCPGSRSCRGHISWPFTLPSRANPCRRGWRSRPPTNGSVPTPTPEEQEELDRLAERGGCARGGGGGDRAAASQVSGGSVQRAAYAGATDFAVVTNSEFGQPPMNLPDSNTGQRDVCAGATADSVSAGKVVVVRYVMAGGKRSPVAPQRDFLS